MERLAKKAEKERTKEQAKVKKVSVFKLNVYLLMSIL